MRSDTALARELGRDGIFDRGNATRILRGKFGVSRGFLDCLETKFGFRRRHYIETGEWPDDKSQAERISRLPKAEFQALLEIAAAPGIHDLLAGIPSGRLSDLIALLRMPEKQIRALVANAPRFTEEADEEVRRFMTLSRKKRKALLDLLDL